nr:MAG TPA: hypothetical protein [Caudoviricetes sp.]
MMMFRFEMITVAIFHTSLFVAANAVPICHGVRIHHFDFGNIRHIRGVIAHMRHIGLCHDSVQGNQLIQTNKAFMVHINDHSVFASSTCAFAPRSCTDIQLTFAVFVDNIVFQQIVQNAFGCQFRNLGIYQIQILFIRYQNVVGNSCAVITSRRPSGRNGSIDVQQDFVRCFVLPVGCAFRTICHSGFCHVRMIYQTVCAILRKTSIDVLVHMFVIAQADTLLKQLIQTSANVARFLHIHKHDTQCHRIYMRLKQPFVQRSLYNRNTVCATRCDRAVTTTTCYTILHRQGRGKIYPTAACFDRYISRICHTGQRLPDDWISFFQFRSQKRIAGSNPCCVHYRHTHWLCLFGSNDTTVKDTHIVITHIVPSLRIVHSQDAQFCNTIGICRTCPLTVGQFYYFAAVVFCLESTNLSSREAAIFCCTDINFTAQLCSTSLAENIDAASLEYRYRFCGCVFTLPLIQIVQRAFHLSGSNAHKLIRCGRRPHLYHCHTVSGIFQWCAERNICASSCGSCVDNHIRLSGIRTSLTIRHTSADYLCIQSHIFHTPFLIL